MSVDWKSLIGAKTADEVVQEAFQKLEEKGSAITNLNVGGVFRTLLELVGQLIGDFYGLLESVVRQGFLVHSTGKWLDLAVADLDIERHEALKTQGLVKFYRENAEGNVTIGTNVLISTKASAQGESLKYLVMEQTILPDGESEVYVPIEAEEAGGEYNVAAGMITEIVTHVPGIDGVVNDAPEGSATWITREGTDEESDDSLRERGLLQWYELATGTVRNSYVSWAKKVNGVTAVTVDDQFPRGDGTVDVIIMGESGEPTQQLIDDVQTYIDARRPICSDVLVRGPDLVPVDVRIRAYIPTNEGDSDVTQAEIEALVHSLLDTGDQAESPRLIMGQDLVKARLTQLAMGAADVINVVVEQPESDVPADVDELITLQSIEVIVERQET